MKGQDDVAVQQCAWHSIQALKVNRAPL